MAGIIVGWDGTIANIPSGWNLCNGTSGTPNLLDKYLKSVGAAENPGATGGATTHTHTSPAHTHTQDGHIHSATSGTPINVIGGYYGYAGSDCCYDSHTHTISYATTVAVNQTTIVTLDSTSSDPPYYKLAFIYDSAVSRYPVGSVILWNSATLPNGWSLHVGLKNVFAKSVGSGENPGGTGGSSTSHTHTNTAHNHTQNGHTHSVSHGIDAAYIFNYGGIPLVNPVGHAHAVSSDTVIITNQTSSVSIVSGDGQPSFYKLSYIKNTGASANRPKNSIVNWSGTIANIPSGYVLCDGTNSTSDLRNYFVKGANDSSELGNTGGSATHVHTASSHNHIQDAHSHVTTIAMSNTITVRPYGSGTLVAFGNHQHALTVTNTATNQATTITVDSVNSEPPYYKTAFIMQSIELDAMAFAFMM